MAQTKEQQRISRTLSYLLRHAPESAGLTMGDDGYVDVSALIAALKTQGVVCDRAMIAQVVASNDKQRFELTGNKIRAVQGHSRPVDLNLKPSSPPERLYHGTTLSALPNIFRDGLKRMSRMHVHLTADVTTATSTGSRHGTPVVLLVKAGEMEIAGFEFFQAKNGVWLTEQVPSEFLDVVEGA